VAAAMRGLLRMPNYDQRERLVRSLPLQPLLVRVLTAGDADEPISEPLLPAPVPATAQIASTIALRHQELKIRAQAVEEAMRLRRGVEARMTCSVLAASGEEGRDLLRLMAAVGAAGDAPAEALGGVLAAAAKGGQG